MLDVTLVVLTLLCFVFYWLALVWFLAWVACVDLFVWFGDVCCCFVRMVNSVARLKIFTVYSL